jgi:hypothetical protein
MKFGEILKEGIIGGIIIILIEFVLGIIAPGVVYAFGYIALIIGGAIAGWMIKDRNDAVVAGIVAGLVYIVFGLYAIYPLFGHYHSGSAAAALVVGIVLGALGGFAGNWICSSQGSSKKKR